MSINSTQSNTLLQNETFSRNNRKDKIYSTYTDIITHVKHIPQTLNLLRSRPLHQSLNRSNARSALTSEKPETTITTDSHRTAIALPGGKSTKFSFWALSDPTFAIWTIELSLTLMFSFNVTVKSGRPLMKSASSLYGVTLLLCCIFASKIISSTTPKPK